MMHRGLRAILSIEQGCLQETGQTHNRCRSLLERGRTCYNEWVSHPHALRCDSFERNQDPLATAPESCCTLGNRRARQAAVVNTTATLQVVTANDWLYPRHYEQKARVLQKARKGPAVSWILREVERCSEATMGLTEICEQPGEFHLQVLRILRPLSHWDHRVRGDSLGLTEMPVGLT